MTKFIFNKLIRDFFPEKMAKEDVKINYKSTSGDELLRHLKNKLIEESEEVNVSDSQEELIEEIGDVMDVLEAICDNASITDEEIEKARKEKESERGKFKKGIFAYDVEMIDHNNEYYDYLVKKYPIKEE